MGGNDTLFGGIAASLTEFRSEVEGAAGRKIRAMGGSKGPLPELVRSVLTVQAQALAWLHELVVKSEQQSTSADAVLAALEVIDSIGALGRSLKFGDTPALLGLPAEPFEQLSAALIKADEVLDYGLKIGALLPRPEELAQARGELERLLGKRVDPRLTLPGSLEQLLLDIAAVKRC